jgi:hypothetical protein
VCQHCEYRGPVVGNGRVSCVEARMGLLNSPPILFLSALFVFYQCFLVLPSILIVVVILLELRNSCAFGTLFLASQQLVLPSASSNLQISAPPHPRNNPTASILPERPLSDHLTSYPTLKLALRDLLIVLPPALHTTSTLLFAFLTISSSSSSFYTWSFSPRSTDPNPRRRCRRQGQLGSPRCAHGNGSW